MDGTRALVVALLLCLAPLGGISAMAQQDDTTTMNVVSAGDTAEYLTPPSERIDRSSQQTTSIDAAAAASANAGEVRTTYYRVSLQRTYRATSDTEKRREVVRNGTERLVERVDDLERTERTTIERYRNGAISEKRLLRRLAVIDRKAETIESTVEWLETRAENLDMDNTESRLALQRVRLRVLQGPVRTNADEAVAGGDDARIHLDVSGDGIVLATVDRTNGEVTYLREAYDPSARTSDLDEQNAMGLSAAEERLQELYPWVTNNSTPTAAPIGPDYARLWRFSYSHPHGGLETYLGVSTEQIVLERQRTKPELVPTEADETSNGNLRMLLNRTRAGGPLGITVYDAQTGVSVDAEIEINDDTVGSTDSERFWTVAPRGTTTINVTHQGETLTYQTTFQ